MKLTLAASVLALSTLAMAQDSSPRFSLITASANKDFHMKSVNAAGQQLWINRPTASYCPVEIVGDACPAGSVTSFAGGNDTMGMNVMVPGGQQGV